jgi:hypothetical protein
MDFQGEFETHITLDCAPDKLELLVRWSEKRELKFVHIVLSRGETGSQPMLTRHSTGTLQSELRRAQELSRECESAGFPVARVKLEVAPHNSAVPRQIANVDSEQSYFEHHIKLLLPPDADLDALQLETEKHGVHLSRNARRFRDDGQQERFVTGRCYGVGRLEAKSAFDALLQTLRAFPFPVLETEEEFVVYDSNLALDAGWLEPAAPSP